MEGFLDGRLGWWRWIGSVVVVVWAGAWVGHEDFHVLFTHVLDVLVALLTVVSIRHNLVLRVTPEREQILQVFCGQVKATSARTCSHTPAWEPWLWWPGTSGPAGGNV